ncbi:MAG: DUF2330 domain-containing protein [Deltaproteobacteria bacterium]|nr:DUF2330 domain-containing protein [Deltaproteobacteria bacterium]
MRAQLSIALGLSAALAVVVVPRPLLACGGFYAAEIEVASDQNIIVTHRGGVETYVFRPHFCGAAKDFGVILPIPATLSGTPALADNALFDELDRFTEPETVEECEARGLGCGASAGDGDLGTRGAQDHGVNVVDRGRVGIFEYVLLQATTTSAFTDWLTQNGFPYDAGMSAVYESYVTRQWYFVAFKVSADTTAPPAGKKLCGDLGPLQVSFATPSPVIPARIAAVNSANVAAPVWRLFVVTAAQQAVTNTSFSSSLNFSRPLRNADLGGFPALAAVAQDGERLTVLDVTFPWNGASDDINLQVDPNQRDFRSVRHVTRECGGLGCAGSNLATSASGVALVLAAIGRMRRRR